MDGRIGGTRKELDELYKKAEKKHSMDGSTALPLDETWDNLLAWVADYCGGGGTARRASYSREDMRYAFAAGYAKRRGEQ